MAIMIGSSFQTRHVLPQGYTKTFQGDTGMNGANRIRFQVLKLTCLDCACRTSAIFPLLFQNHPVATLQKKDKARTHYVYFILSQFHRYCILPQCEKNTKGTTKNIKGSLLELRYSDSPSHLICGWMHCP